MPARRLADLALAFLDSLGDEQRKRAFFAFDAVERTDWHYIPRRRPGLAFGEMNAGQRGAADALLRHALSDAGYAKAHDIMRLETVLRRLETFGLFRDPENYALAVFGDPRRLPWAWRIEGHHLSVTVTPVTDDAVAITPSFFGAHPAHVHDGAERGRRVLAAEEDLARALITALPEPARRQALIGARSLGDIVTGPGRADRLREPEGISLGALAESERGLALRLMEEYLGNARADFADPLRRRVREAGIERIRFAWAGPTEPGRPHYYRLHGPMLLIEYDNTQNDANHIHSVLRDLQNDFGRDFLADHYAHGHRHEGHP